MKTPQIYLKSWRVIKLLSQQDVANLSGIPQSLISRIERGHDTRLSTLSRLADTLEIPVEALFSPPKETTIPLDRHTVDVIAKMIISGDRTGPPTVNRLADTLTATVSQKLAAAQAAGRFRNHGRHWRAPRRLPEAKKLFGEQAVRQILNRVNRLLIMAATIS